MQSHPARDCRLIEERPGARLPEEGRLYFSLVEEQGDPCRRRSKVQGSAQPQNCLRCLAPTHRQLCTHTTGQKLPATVA